MFCGGAGRIGHPLTEICCPCHDCRPFMSELRRLAFLKLLWIRYAFSTKRTFPSFPVRLLLTRTTAPMNAARFARPHVHPGRRLFAKHLAGRQGCRWPGHETAPLWRFLRAVSPSRRCEENSPPPPSDFRADYSCASNSLTDAEAQYADAR